MEPMSYGSIKFRRAEAFVSAAGDHGHDDLHAVVVEHERGHVGPIEPHDHNH